MIPLLTPDAIHTAVGQLSSRALIRLVTEIDDNGAIPPRRLPATLPDVPAHQLRRAAGTARALGLVRVVPGSGLHLTGAGSELADLYDEAARTARRHHLPGPVCEFTDRIRHVLGLLAPAPATRDDGDINGQGPATAGHQDADGAAQGEVLAGVRVLLLGWLARHPQAAPLLVLGQAA